MCDILATPPEFNMQALYVRLSTGCALKILLNVVVFIMSLWKGLNKMGCD